MESVDLSSVLSEGLEKGVMRNRTLRDGRAVNILDVHVSKDLSVYVVATHPTIVCVNTERPSHPLFQCKVLLGSRVAS